jgi:hypothetical protein
MEAYGASRSEIGMDYKLSNLKRRTRRQGIDNNLHVWVWRRKIEDGYFERYDFPIDDLDSHAYNVSKYLLWYHKEPNMGEAGVQCVTTHFDVFKLKDKTVIYQCLQWLDYGV